MPYQLFTDILIRYGVNNGCPASLVNTFLHFSSLSLSRFGTLRATVRKRQRHSFRVRIPPLAKVSRARTLKPPKATAKPYSRHILGIDSGVQSQPKATSRPHQSHTKATPKPHQSLTKARPKPPATCFAGQAARACKALSGGVRNAG